MARLILCCIVRAKTSTLLRARSCVPSVFDLLILFALLVLALVPSKADQVPGASAQTGSTFVADSLGKGTMSLDGPWQFHMGDNPAWADPALDDRHWEQLSADKPWGAQGHAGYIGYGWYRRHIRVFPTPGAAISLAILFPAIDDAYELYWNGTLVGEFGKLAPHPVFYENAAAQTFGLGQAQSGVLAVRVWKAPPDTSINPFFGGFEAVPIIGNSEGIAHYKAALDYEWIRSRQFNFGLNSLYALTALLALLAWLRDRRQWVLLCLTGFCASPPLMLLLMQMRLPIPRAPSILLFGPFLALKDVSLWFLLLLLLRLDEKTALARWVRILACIQVAITAIDSLNVYFMLTAGTAWAWQGELVDEVLTVFYTGMELFPLVLVSYAAARHRGLTAARWLVAATAFLTGMIFIVSLAARQGRQFTRSTLAEKLDVPLVSVYGNAINAQTFADVLLLASLIFAVFLLSAEERRRQQVLEQEFRNARELQQILIPETIPDVPGFVLTSGYKPALEVGGDFFQIVPLENGQTLIVLGDVSGKGLKAAMAVSLIVGTIRTLAEFTKSPAQILSGLSHRLNGRLQGGFATTIALRLDQDGSCIVANAGHPSPFLNDQELTFPGALPLGLVPSVSYEESLIWLDRGDRLTLYTDGLLEARKTSGELFGFDRLKELFATRPSAGQAIQAGVVFGQDDDITVLTVTRLIAGEKSSVEYATSILSRT
jgi:Stage II sporulation protein E (SpoIIE)